jgi:hypothetical protein
MTADIPKYSVILLLISTGIIVSSFFSASSQTADTHGAGTAELSLLSAGFQDTHI